MARSREVEQKARVRQALRAVRRQYRAADSSGERFERRIDLLIERKTRVYADELEPLYQQFKDYKGRLATLEKSLADAVTIAGY